jgi:putative ABC transport system ATP-binding protein
MSASEALSTMPAPGFTSLSAGPPAVVLRGVTKEYGSGETRVVALRGIDLELPYGEMTLLVGPSGCGKTTLISMVAGLLDTTAGEIEVLGQPLSRMSDRRKVPFRGANIGFVFQQYNLLPSLTAAENVAVPLLIARQPRGEAVKKGRQLLAEVGMGEKAEAYPTNLSGGQQQRVAIARALIHQPRLLVCDEPTAALDAHSGQVVMGLIRRVALQANRAVIVVTHDSRVYKFGDRIVRMNDGRIDSVEVQMADPTVT